MVELGLVALTAAGHWVVDDALGRKAVFIAGAAIVWTAYVGWMLRTSGRARQWGFRGDTIPPSLAANGIFFLFGAAAMIGIGVARGRGAPSTGFFFLIGLYPLWGILQQFVLGSILCRNLRALTGRSFTAVTGAAALFGLVHAPQWGLMALCALAAVPWCAFFLRWPNVWIQGVAHGWMGAIAYHFLLDRDPWLDLLRGLG